MLDTQFLPVLPAKAYAKLSGKLHGEFRLSEMKNLLFSLS